MGKKAANPNTGKGKKVAKELEPKSRTVVINLHRRLYKQSFKKKAPTAVKEIKEHARKTMFTEDVRLDPSLNQQLWRNGIRNLDRRITVVFDRKKNEDEEAKHKFYTLVKSA
jgi:large subunit ribosomal protein L31e